MSASNNIQDSREKNVGTSKHSINYKTQECFTDAQTITSRNTGYSRQQIQDNTDCEQAVNNALQAFLICEKTTNSC